MGPSLLFFKIDIMNLSRSEKKQTYETQQVENGALNIETLIFTCESEERSHLRDVLYSSLLEWLDFVILSGG